MSEIIDPPAPTGTNPIQRLKPNAVGLVGVLFMAVATAAPITAMVGNVPIAVGYGNGAFAPAGYFVATIVLTLFAIGYAAMSKHITATGAFYGYISHGLGRIVGLGAGFLTALAYMVFEASLIGIFSFFGTDLFTSLFGVDVPWIVFALVMLGVASLLMIPLAWGLREPGFGGATAVPREQSISQALREAFKYPSFQLLMAGYFVCGFQVVFIGVHMPSYLKDHGMAPGVATTALALIGLFNVFGTYTAGWLGGRMPKRYILSGIYALRAVVISLFLVAPLTPMSVYIFAATMGFLWLSTVPPTNAVIAQIFGVQYMSTLGGFVFFSHQVGSFLGAWLGGKLYDLTGSYDVVWGIAIALGVFAALANLPVREEPIPRGQPAVAGA